MRTSLLLATLLVIGPLVRAAEPSKIDYNRDIKPILANSCFTCHGPDEKARKAKLRLDLREEAIRSAIKPKDSAQSPLIQRITSNDATEVMPPPAAKKTSINAEQLALLKRWIDEGANYDEHWAYRKPVKPAIPQINDPQLKSWVQSPIDAFIAKGFEMNKLTPAPVADRVTLARRLAFDLIGIAPSPSEVDRFVNDKSPEAYQNYVNSLLSSPHYGERMAQMWLDAVRYADTGGYHSDNHRDVWMYRDWVIQSFNQNKPFDRFTIEQLAGDLLKDANDQTRIASGYNRLLMTTEEGGAQPKEYTAKYAADRVRNASAVWLGSTLGCAECHNHKYDPFTMRDFYRFAAFFADVQETAVGRQQQTPIMTEEQKAQVKKLDDLINEKKMAIAQAVLSQENQTKWEQQIKADPKTDPKKTPKNITDILAIEPEKRNATQQKTLADYYRNNAAPETAEARKALEQANAEKANLLKKIPSTLITMSAPPRTVRILPRGNWLDETGEIVTPEVPSFLGKIAPDDPKQRANRLDLAQWLTSKDHPLTARVFVNRVWKIMFGQGLVRNMEDFGILGTPPTHPELLDYLAVEFMESGWDVKKLVSRLAHTATYQQASTASKALREKDPTNIWLARQNRYRIDAEFIRDTALSVSGLLSTKLGGPSVNPYQPAGYWRYLNFPTREWANSTGPDQYRRGLYTYWCRTFPHPSLTAFDAPSREECTNERPRSSTPLQALALLNDPTYVETAKALAIRALREGGASDKEKFAFLIKQVLSRPIEEAELTILQNLLDKHRQQYQQDEASAQALAKIGYATPPAGTNLSELAAWTSVCRVLLNLHEAITRI
ncbi:MAG: PSD1 and planctomycete cytochrome C domain-containing protein [Gemmataceae bacterium]|jgi:hypothetical protein|nr:PSD1 and planctomycete cytochrome C domain-containing protein [Gemmataceae bacterium]